MCPGILLADIQLMFENSRYFMLGKCQCQYHVWENDWLSNGRSGGPEPVLEKKLLIEQQYILGKVIKSGDIILPVSKSSIVQNPQAACYLSLVRGSSEPQSELCAVAECVWHHDVFIEVVWISTAVSLDLVNSLMGRDDRCLLSIHSGKFWWGLVNKNIVWNVPPLMRKCS